MKDYIGSKYRIIHCAGTFESFDDAIAKHSKDKRDLYKAQMTAIIKRLGDGGRMTNEIFPQEGELSDKSHFRPLKKIPIRAYIWLSKKSLIFFFFNFWIGRAWRVLGECRKTENGAFDNGFKACNNGFKVGYFG
jgi:hypothetical protein